jgi:hypothetical protein
MLVGEVTCCVVMSWLGGGLLLYDNAAVAGRIAVGCASGRSEVEETVVTISVAAAVAPSCKHHLP